MPQRHFSPTRLLSVALTVALLAGSLAAVAAPRAQQDRGQRPDAVDRELAETLERVLILRLQKALDLSAEQEETVVPLMQDLTRQRRERARRRMEAMRTLSAMAQDSTVDGDVLRDRLDRLYTDQAAALKDEVKLLREIRAELTPRQEVRLLHVEERFRTEIRQRLQDARRERERARPRTDRPSPGSPRNR